jgi:hypothetical protein
MLMQHHHDKPLLFKLGTFIDWEGIAARAYFAQPG